MRTLLAGLTIAAALLYAQARPSRSVAGTVSDPDGKPIAEARIDHWSVIGTLQTDAAGKFSLQTGAVAVVIRKGGYRSEWVRIADVSEVQVTLHPADLNPQIRACSRTEPCDSIRGWNAQFCFPRVRGIQASRQVQDADYGFRSYMITTGKRRAGIRHGRGPMWNWGLPSNTDVWGSVEYRETVFGADPFITIDARGRMADGKLWRTLAKFGESASYGDMSENDAKLLDQVLDGVCIRSDQR